MTSKKQVDDIDIEKIMQKKAEAFLVAFEELKQEHGFNFICSAFINRGLIDARISHIQSLDGKWVYPLSTNRQGNNR
jgi:hypothetical protein